MEVFSVFDTKAESYLQPFFAANRALALRSFSDAANNASSQFAKHASDFVLFRIGTWDDQTATFESCAPENLGNAAQYKDSEQ